MGDSATDRSHAAEPPAQPGAGAWLHWRLWPWTVLALALVVTVAAALGVGEFLKARHGAAVEAAIDDEAAQVEARMGTYLALLRATRSFIAAQGQALTAAAFREFVGAIEVARHYPGIQGIGYSPRVVPGPTAGSGAAGRPGASPPGERKWTFSILYLEPMDERNAAALGYDMFSEPVRAAAMARARDTGEPALTRRVVLKQEIDQLKAGGFLLYLPYYGPGPEPRTVEERRERLVAFVYAPFRAPDFFQTIPAPALRRARLQRAYAAAAADREQLLYEAPQPLRVGPSKLRQLTLHGQTWTLEFAGEEPPPGDRLQVLATAGAGLVISLLLFLLVRSLRQSHAATAQTARAERGQRQLAESLLASERSARHSAEEQHALLARQVQFSELLVGIVSHDLRNPLNVIMLNGELLKRSDLPAPLARSVERIQDAGRLSLALIRDLLDFTQARLGSGIPITRHPDDLIAIVAKAVDALHSTHPQRELVLHTSGDGAGLWDGDRLVQVVTNLVTNALVHGRPDAPVTVEVSAGPDRAVLSVHNEGEPIAPELQTAIFEPLRQGSGRRGSGARNIGLGLYIVRQIVHAHGGTVQVSSSAAQGTTFRVELPRAAA